MNDKQFGEDARLHHRQVIRPRSSADEFSPEARKARAEQQKQGGGITKEESARRESVAKKMGLPSAVPGAAGRNKQGEIVPAQSHTSSTLSPVKKGAASHREQLEKRKENSPTERMRRMRTESEQEYHNRPASEK